MTIFKTQPFSFYAPFGQKTVFLTKGRILEQASKKEGHLSPRYIYITHTYVHIFLHITHICLMKPEGISDPIGQMIFTRQLPLLKLSRMEIRREGSLSRFLDLGFPWTFDLSNMSLPRPKPQSSQSIAIIINPHEQMAV